MMMKFILFYVLAQLIIFVLSEECPKQFDGKCKCGVIDYDKDGGKRYVVNCTDTGFKNTTVLENLPEQIQVLIFTGNFIEELPWNIFGAFNDLSSLTIVDMSNNHIREIRGKSFHHIQNVKRLILNHNNLSISRDDDEINHHHPRVFSNFINLSELHLTNAFADNTSSELSEDLHDIFVNSNLTKLTKLHLEQNEISHFSDPRVFCDLPSLTDLYLGDNLLNEINFDILCLRHLRYLDLERNKFTTFKPNDLIDLNTLQSVRNHNHELEKLMVDFTHNPLTCDCRIRYFEDWLEKTNVTVRNVKNLACYRNGHYDEHIFLTTKNCIARNDSNNTYESSEHTGPLVVILVILVIILLALIAALLYVSKDRYRNMLRPVLNSVTKKVQYSTIKDEECPEVHV